MVRFLFEAILARVRASGVTPRTDSRASMPASPGGSPQPRWAQKRPNRGQLPATGFAMGCYTKECSANGIAYLRST